MRKSKSKKGVLFSLGLTFLSLLILSLAVLIFHSTQGSESIASKIAIIDRVYELDVSIGQSLKDIFQIKSGIVINITNTSVYFQEALPNTNADSFNASMKSFKSFIELNMSYVNITLNETLDDLPLKVMPYDITYRHAGFGGKNIEIVPNTINFNGYSVFMRLNKNVSSCNWNIQEGSFNFSVEIIGPNGDSCSNSVYIEPSGVNSVIVNGNVNVYVDDNILQISIDGSDTNAEIKAGIIANTNNAYVEYGNPVIMISFGELGVSKASNSRLT